MFRIIIGLVLLLSAAFPALAAAGDQATPLSEEAIQERQAYIESRLNRGRKAACAWQYGWSGFFAVRTVMQGFQAIDSSNGDNQAKYAVGAIKSAAGLALLLLRPLPAVEGAAPIEAMPTDTRAQREARLKAAEDRLDTNARRARERTSWPRHLTGIAVNLIGGTAIAALGDVRDAAFSNITGIAIVQAHIWSQPAGAIDDLAEYERRFPSVSTSDETAWELTPIPGGLGITIRF